MADDAFSKSSFVGVQFKVMQFNPVSNEQERRGLKCNKIFEGGNRFIRAEYHQQT